jgi:hypothetical protein
MRQHAGATRRQIPRTDGSTRTQHVEVAARPDAKVSTRIEVAVHLTAAGTRTASPKGDGSIETKGDTP